MKKGNSTKVRYYKVQYRTYEPKYFLTESPTQAVFNWIFDILDLCDYYSESSYVSKKYFELMKEHCISKEDGCFEAATAVFGDKQDMVEISPYTDPENILFRVKIKEVTAEEAEPHIYEKIY